METSTTALAQQLAAIQVFSDLAPEDVSWLASQMEVAHFAPGEIVVAEDSPADRMFVILEGEIGGHRERGPGDGFRPPQLRSIVVHHAPKPDRRTPSLNPMCHSRSRRLIADSPMRRDVRSDDEGRRLQAAPQSSRAKHWREDDDLARPS